MAQKPSNQDVCLFGSSNYALTLEATLTPKLRLRGPSRTELGAYVSGLMAHNGFRISDQGYAVSVFCHWHSRMQKGWLIVENHMVPKTHCLHFDTLEPKWKPRSAAQFLVTWLHAWWEPQADDLQAKLTPSMIIQLMRENLKTVPALKGVYIDWETKDGNFMPYLEGKTYYVPSLPQVSLLHGRCMDGSEFYLTPKGPRLTWDPLLEQVPLAPELQKLQSIPISDMGRA